MLLEDLSQAITLFILGMGTVFVLLTLLISTVSVLSVICQKLEASLGSASDNIATSRPSAANQMGGNSISDQERAIVVAAVHSHRQAKGL